MTLVTAMPRAGLPMLSAIPVPGNRPIPPLRQRGDLDTAAVLPGRRAERRRRLAGPDLKFRAFCARGGLPASPAPQLERPWDARPAWRAGRCRRGEIGQRPAGTGGPFRLC